MRTLIAAILAMTSLLAMSSVAHAAADITFADLQAAGRAIGFLNGISSGGALTVGVVYAENENGISKASSVVALLNGMPGPSKAKFRAILVPATSLSQSTGRFDAVILMPNQLLSSNDIAAAVRHRRVLSISTDPGCLDAKCCVILVQTGERVRVVLNTGLADAVGARFSSIFMMMVERK